MNRCHICITTYPYFFKKKFQYETLYVHCWFRFTLSITNHSYLMSFGTQKRIVSLESTHKPAFNNWAPLRDPLSHQDNFLILGNPICNEFRDFCCHFVKYCCIRNINYIFLTSDIQCVRGCRIEEYYFSVTFLILQVSLSTKLHFKSFNAYYFLDIDVLAYHPKYVTCEVILSSQ